MDNTQLQTIANAVLSAWNTQDAEKVVSCYTEDLLYCDPNTRGYVEGADAMRRYLKKLFQGWRMNWRLKEAFPLSDQEGYAILWRATLKKIDGDQSVDVDGMDLVLTRGTLIKRNEVYFDRSVFMALL